jgi:hypothetical protein
MWSSDLNSYADGSIATGMVSLTGQAKSEVEAKEKYVFQAEGWAWGWHPNPIKKSLLSKQCNLI